MAQLDILHLSAPNLLVSLAVLFFGYNIIHSFYHGARIRKLGPRAPIRRHYLPYGIDIAYEAVMTAVGAVAPKELDVILTHPPKAQDVDIEDSKNDLTIQAPYQEQPRKPRSKLRKAMILTALYETRC